jgi:hypothetical protein
LVPSGNAAVHKNSAGRHRYRGSLLRISTGIAGVMLSSGIVAGSGVDIKFVRLAILFVFLTLISLTGGGRPALLDILAFFVVLVHGLAFVLLRTERTVDGFNGFDHHPIVFAAVAAFSAPVGTSGDTSGNEYCHCRQHESFFHNYSSSYDDGTMPPLTSPKYNYTRF